MLGALSEHKRNHRNHTYHMSTNISEDSRGRSHAANTSAAAGAKPTGPRTATPGAKSGAARTAAPANIAAATTTDSDAIADAIDAEADAFADGDADSGADGYAGTDESGTCDAAALAASAAAAARSAAAAGAAAITTADINLELKTATASFNSRVKAAVAVESAIKAREKINSDAIAAITAGESIATYCIIRPKEYTETELQSVRTSINNDHPNLHQQIIIFLWGAEQSTAVNGMAALAQAVSMRGKTTYCGFNYIWRILKNFGWQDLFYLDLSKDTPDRVYIHVSPSAVRYAQLEDKAWSRSHALSYDVISRLIKGQDYFLAKEDVCGKRNRGGPPTLEKEELQLYILKNGPYGLREQGQHSIAQANTGTSSADGDADADADADGDADADNFSADADSFSADADANVISTGVSRSSSTSIPMEVAAVAPTAASPPAAAAAPATAAAVASPFCADAMTDAASAVVMESDVGAGAADFAVGPVSAASTPGAGGGFAAAGGGFAAAAASAGAGAGAVSTMSSIADALPPPIVNRTSPNDPAPVVSVELMAPYSPHLEQVLCAQTDPTFQALTADRPGAGAVTLCLTSNVHKFEGHAVRVHYESGYLLGRMVQSTELGVMRAQVDFLWVYKTHRCQGHGERLLSAFKVELRKRNVGLAFLGLDRCTVFVAVTPQVVDRLQFWQVNGFVAENGGSTMAHTFAL